jgi:TatD DNase family protein
MPLFEGLLAKTRYVGEVGLDGSPDLKTYADIHRRVFDAVLSACSKAGGRVISIRSRRAADDVLDALARMPDAGLPILHWFSGGTVKLFS